jgi:hypothetical protein
MHGGLVADLDGIERTPQNDMLASRIQYESSDYCFHSGFFFRGKYNRRMCLLFFSLFSFSLFLVAREAYYIGRAVPAMAQQMARPLAEALTAIHESRLRPTAVSELEAEAMREALVSALCAAQQQRDFERKPKPVPPPVPTPMARPDPPPFIHSAESLRAESERRKRCPPRLQRSNLGDNMQVMEACQLAPDSIFDARNTHLRLGLTNIETLPKRFPPVAVSPRQEKAAPMPKQHGGSNSAFQPFSAAIHPPMGSFRNKADEKVLHMPYTVFTQPAKLPSMERAYLLGPPRESAYH